MGDRLYSAKWIPRENNSVCDTLARQAVSATSPALVILDDDFEEFSQLWN